MKKVFAMLMVCGLAVAFVACGGAKTEGSGDSTAVATPDTTMAPAPDTTVKADSAK